MYSLSQEQTKLHQQNNCNLLLNLFSSHFNQSLQIVANNEYIYGLYKYIYKLYRFSI